MKEPLISILRRRLVKSEGRHWIIAKDAGVAQSTVSRIHCGACDPRTSVTQKLLDYFDREDDRDARQRGKLSAVVVPSAARQRGRKLHGSGSKRSTTSSLS